MDTYKLQTPRASRKCIQQRLPKMRVTVRSGLRNISVGVDWKGRTIALQENLSSDLIANRAMGPGQRAKVPIVIYDVKSES